MKKVLFILVPVFLALAVSANNIHVANVSVTGINTTSHSAMVKFDLSWDNSWRVTGGPKNWDAAWVFVKYRVQGQTSWSHATLHYANGSGTGDGHLVPANATIASSNDNPGGGANGVFIYHNTPMSQGSVSYTNTELRWDYGVNGVADNAQVNVQVFAIEMAYVPQGGFYVGSGGKEVGAFYTYPDTTQPYYISSEAAITVGAANGQLYYKPTGSTDDYAGPIPAAFPKGFQAFYCMKYEITQDQYVTFLNSLESVQASTRSGDAINRPNGRTIITSTGPGQYATSLPYVPMGEISFEDVSAYLDWCALRPMTELEYEKACRGTNNPVPNEFSWGTPTLIGYNPLNGTSTPINYSLSNSGTADEGIVNNYSPGPGNAMWLYSMGPVQGAFRAGIFAANTANTGRVTAGSSFYGIMEMTGNVTEDLIPVGNADGRSYNGHAGNGQLASNGTQDENWPTLYTGGIGFRGGYYLEKSPTALMVSDRSTAVNIASLLSGYAGFGGRGVRTAP